MKTKWVNCVDIIKIVIKGASVYGPVDEAYEDKVTLTESSISYEYKPHPMSELKTNVPMKWSYKTNSPLFKQVYKEVAAKTPYFLYNDEVLFATDIGPTEIIATFEDKHKETVNYFCPSEFFLEYFRLIKKLVPETEYTPAVLLTEDDFGDEDSEI